MSGGNADYTYPLRGAGFSSEVLDAQSAKHKVAKLLDGTATDSSRMLASALMSGMTPANAQWLNLDSESLPDDAKAWLSTCATLVWENIHAANFDAEGYEANLDVVCAGWFVLYVDEDRDEGGYSFQQWPLAQCYVASTRKDGIVDTIFRCYQLTAEQAIAEFGQDAVSEKIRDAAKKSQTTNLIFCTRFSRARITWLTRAWLKPALRVVQHRCDRKSGARIRLSRIPVLRAALDENPRWFVRHRPGL